MHETYLIMVSIEIFLSQSGAIISVKFIFPNWIVVLPGQNSSVILSMQIMILYYVLYNNTK